MDFAEKFRSVLNDFLPVANLAGVVLRDSDLQVSVIPAPHIAGSFIPKKNALYGFYCGQEWLKIGIISAGNNARFYSHHYGPNRTKSNLSRSILKDVVRRGDLDEQTVGAWIKEHCHRINVLIPQELGMPIVRLLEAFMHVRLNPVYER